METIVSKEALDEIDLLIRRMVNKDPRLTHNSTNKQVIAFIAKHTQIKWLGSVDVHFRVNGGGYSSIQSRLIEMYEVAVEVDKLAIRGADKKVLFDNWCSGWNKGKLIAIGKDLAEAQRKRLGYTAEHFLEMPSKDRKGILANYEKYEELSQKNKENTNSTPPDIVVPTVKNAKKSLENIKRLRLNPSGVTHTVSPNCGSSDGWTL